MRALSLTALLAIAGLSALQISCSSTPTEHDPDHAVSNSSSAAASAAGHWGADTTVGAVVAERPQTASIFALAGIDYCCGGEIRLADAAAAAGIELPRLVSALEAAGSSRVEGVERDWRHVDMRSLIDHIVDTHHTWLRRELPDLTSTAHTVLRVHGDTHPELTEVIATLDDVHRSVLPHLDDEEQRVFPALIALESGQSPEGIDDLLTAMHDDHDELGGALERLRALTRDYEVPEDSCAKYREMLSALEALERDMHRHVHLENNVLLPRARALQTERSSTD